MTVERRFVAGLKDIRAVVLECKKCKTRLSLKPERLASEDHPSACPACGHHWLSTQPSQGRFFVDDVLLFLTQLPPSIKKQDDDSMGALVFFEFDEPTR